MPPNTRRRDVLSIAAVLATATLAGCGGDSDESRGSGATSGDDQRPKTSDEEPQLQDVNLVLEGSDKADFTGNEEYELGLTAELQYSDGSTEARDIEDYEVENATVRKTSEDGKTGDEDGYGVLNGIGENLDFTEFTDDDLRKASHYQELEDVEIQEGEIILDSDDLITGYSRIDLSLNITENEISDYIENNPTYQNIIQVNKTEEQALQDLQVQGPEAVELWQKYREIRAEIMLDKVDFADIKDVAIEETRNELQDEDNPDIQTELGHLGTEFGREVQERFGVSPSGTTSELADALASADLKTTDINVVPGVISDSGHNSNPVYVPGSNDPSSEEYWSGKTYNVNTQLEDAAYPPDQLRNYASGPYGIIFKDVDEIPRKSEGTFDSFIELSLEIYDNGHDMIDVDYAMSLAPELADDTELWQENLQHIMETAVANLFSTEHDLIPTGSAESPEVELGKVEEEE